MRGRKCDSSDCMKTFTDIVTRGQRTVARLEKGAPISKKVLQKNRQRTVARLEKGAPISKKVLQKNRQCLECLP